MTTARSAAFLSALQNIDSLPPAAQVELVNAVRRRVNVLKMVKVLQEEAPAPAVPVRSLVKRCGCGRQISENKRFCRACWEELKPRLRVRIAEQLAEMPEEQRGATLAGLDKELWPDEYLKKS